MYFLSAAASADSRLLGEEISPAPAGSFRVAASQPAVPLRVKASVVDVCP